MESGIHRHHYLIASIGFLVLAITYYYTFTLTSDATISTDDGISYAAEIEGGGQLIHPHHLLYQLLGWLIWNVNKKLMEGDIRALTSLRLLSALSGAFGIVLLYFVLVRSTSRPRISAFFCIGLAFSRGYWFYSSSAETIIPGAVLSIPVIYVFLRIIQAPSLELYFLLGIMQAAAYAMRQDNVLLSIPLLLICPFLKGGSHRRGLVLYAITLLFSIAAVQMLSFSMAMQGTSSFGNFIEWSRGYTRTPGWGTIENLKPMGLWTDLCRLFHAIGYGSITGIANIAPASVSRGISFMSGVNNIALILFSLCFIFYIFPRVHFISGIDRILAIFCAALIVTREAFYAWWLPENIMAFSIGTMIPLAIVVAVVFSSILDRGVYRRPVATVMVGLILTIITSGALTVIPFSKSTYYARLKSFEEFSQKNDAVIVRHALDYPLVTYYGVRQAAVVDYFGGEQFRSLDEPRLRTMIESAWSGGHRAFLMPAERASGPFDIGHYEQERAFFGSYRLTPVKGENGMTVAWEVLPLFSDRNQPEKQLR